MLKSIFGKKIGMTQIFCADRSAVPTTVVDVKGWFVLQVKTDGIDGYSALQLGKLRKRFEPKGFNSEYMKKKSFFFAYVREVHVEKDLSFEIGQEIKVEDFDGKEVGKSYVCVAGNSSGRGFQGVVKRWGFAGGPGAHGSNFDRTPGSIGNMCSQGKVIKGKKLPGRYGGKRITVSGLRVERVDSELGCIYVRGAVPGKKGSVLCLSSGRGE
jgi:large subunit ribosomal protein L3